jgi:hypothetical protein
MKSAIYMDGKRFIETEFTSENDFERVIKEPVEKYKKVDRMTWEED